MIQANEIRLNNLFLYNYKTDLLSSVEWIRPNSISIVFDRQPDLVNSAVCSVNDLIAIPLTKEWLLKAGFERLFPTGSTYSLRDFNVSDFGENGIYHYDVKQPIKYVHQLQNLYFAMTGEELVFSTTEP